MEPTLVSGDLVFATTLLRKFIKKDNLIVFFDDYYSFIIKRVLKININTIILKSDNIKNDSIFCNKELNKKTKIYTVLFKIRFKRV